MKHINQLLAERLSRMAEQQRERGDAGRRKPRRDGREYALAELRQMLKETPYD